MARDTLFISHATPEDNEFAIWLASKLEMLGYKTWLDKKHLLGGERMWQEIQNVLENEAVKVLFVYSKYIRDNNNQIRSGIFDEISFAKSIAKNESLKDFIIPLHIDDSSYSEIIGFDGVTQILFSISWADGLKMLINKLEKQNVIKNKGTDYLPISSWYENEYLDCCKIIKKVETYYSSWWKISSLPNNFYIHIFKNIQQADIIYKHYFDIPIGRISNNIITFESNLQININDGMYEYEIKADKTFIFSIDDINSGISSETFPTNNDLQIYFKHFLNQILFKLMKSKQLRHYRLSKNIAFYLGSNNKKEFNYINFFYPDSGIKKSKKIGGKYNVHFWNYGISAKPIILPIIGFSLSSHLIFTKDGTNPIEDDSFQATHRRRKAKRFFNSQWRDMLLAFVEYLKDHNNEIKIKVTKNGDYFKLSLWPEIYTSNFGYIEPVIDNEINKEDDDE
jgi:hypothetical protein